MGIASLPEGRLSLEQKREALNKVLSSGLVRENTHLYSLLAYLGEKSLEENAAPLKEYTIGVEALKKPVSYDPRLDPVVRVDIGKLRGKLDSYYRKEGIRDPVRLLIPTGAYLPIYEPAPQSDEKSKPEKTLRLIYVLALMAILAAGMILHLTRQPRGATLLDSPALGAELQAFWKPYLDGAFPTLIVYGTPLFLKFDGYYFRDPSLNDFDRVESYARGEGLTGLLNSTYLQPSFIYTGVGEVQALFSLTRFLTSQDARMRIQSSNQISWEALKEKNVIFLGSEKFNPQLAHLPYAPAFEYAPAFDPAGRTLVRVAPGGGGPSEYRRVYERPYGAVLEDYVLISVYPGLTAGTRLMVLSSSLTEGTAAATEYVTRSDAMKELFQKMRMDPHPQSLPPAFQVVVRAKINAGTPVHLSYVTHENLFPAPTRARQ